MIDDNSDETEFRSWEILVGNAFSAFAMVALLANTFSIGLSGTFCRAIKIYNEIRDLIFSPMHFFLPKVVIPPDLKTILIASTIYVGISARAVAQSTHRLRETKPFVIVNVLLVSALAFAAAVWAWILSGSDEPTWYGDVLILTAATFLALLRIGSFRMIVVILVTNLFACAFWVGFFLLLNSAL